jgi:hypothetical protein
MPRRFDPWVMAALALGLSIVTIAFGERIGINGGQGWDGMGYVLWSRAWNTEVLGKGVTLYHAQRILPSALIHYAGFQDPIFGFQILNTVMMTGTMVLWQHTARRLPRAASWAGFVALLLGFANARHALYYPTLTDPTAMFLGMAAVWAYLEDRPVPQLAVALVAAFTWPALTPLSLAMLVLRNRAVAPVGARWIRWAAIAIPVAAATLVCVVAARWLHHPYPGEDKWVVIVHRALLPVTYASIFALVALGLHLVLRERALWNVRAYARALWTPRLAFALAGCVAVVVLRQLWLRRVATRGSGPTFDQFQCEHLLAALRGPLWGVVHHVVYYGPIVLVAIAAWRRIAKLPWGPAGALGLAMIVGFAVGSQSRQMIHLAPLLVTATIAATASWWTTRRVLVFAVLYLAWSKLWWKIGYDQPLKWSEWPNQRYFMTQGPWASDEMFVVHLAGVLVTAIVLVVLFRDVRSTEPAAI